MSFPQKINPLFNISAYLHASLKQKDITAFEFVYDKYSTPLYSLILCILNDPFTANAILEKVFRKAWSRIAEFDETRSSLFTWLLSIARGETIDQKKNLDRSTTIAQQQSFEFRDLRGLEELINQLPEPCRSVLMLSYIHNAPEIEIAGALNIDLSCVRDCRNKALAIVGKLIAVSPEIKKPSHFPERALAF